MSTPNDPLAGLSAAVDTLTKDVTDKLSAISTEIAALKAQVAGGTGVTQEQLDSLAQKVQSIDSAVTGFSA